VYIQVWGYNFRDDLRTTSVLTKLMESLTLADQKSKTSDVLSATSSIVNQAQILGQASTVRIYSQKCNNVKFSDSLKPLSVGGNTYTLCATTLGSGFVINDSGHVVTNAHIADYNDFDLLLEGSSTDGSYEEDMVNDLIILMLSALNNSTQEISEDEMANLTYSYLLDMYNNDYVSISNLSRDIYIQNNATFEIDEKTAELKNKEKHIKANLVKSNKISSTYESQISQNTNLADTADLAVIQTANTLNLPSIPIEENISVGKKVFVIGYPGIADNSELVSSTQVLSSTVTEGSVSAIKPNSNNTFELLQIDAAVQNGNSGGPIVNEDGNVVGIATYKLRSDSGNYNFGISAKELLSFLETASIQPQSNSMRKSLENSLSDMSISHYKRAHDNLQAMLISQPALATTIQPLIDLCSSKIAAGEDKTSIIDLNNQTTKILILVILVVLLIVAVVLLSINLKKISDKQKQLPQSKLNTQNI
jgi:S1-C subfamily serine protease